MLSYRPYPWLRSGHLQTLMAGLQDGHRPTNQARSLLVHLNDDERLVVHEELGAPVAPSAPLVILAHGLGGDHDSPYLQRVAHQLRQRHRHVWRIDLRGSGQGLELAWRPAHAGSSEDLAAVVIEARRRYPRSPLVLVGFSLSGNILLKMLGELAAGCHPISLSQAGIRQALAIGAPLDLNACADNMERWSRWLYNRYYVRLLEQQAERKRQLWQQWQALPDQPRIRTLRQFDDRYTAPLGGFRDTADYYTRASSIHWLPHIRTPTEIVLDRHDPIVLWQSHLQAQYDPRWVKFTHTQYGGHMGYFGVDDQGRLFRWIEYYVVQRVSHEAPPP